MIKNFKKWRELMVLDFFLFSIEKVWGMILKNAWEPCRSVQNPPVAARYWALWTVKPQQTVAHSFSPSVLRLPRAGLFSESILLDCLVHIDIKCPHAFNPSVRWEMICDTAISFVGKRWRLWSNNRAVQTALSRCFSLRAAVLSRSRCLNKACAATVSVTQVVLSMCVK